MVSSVRWSRWAVLGLALSLWVAGPGCGGDTSDQDGDVSPGDTENGGDVEPEGETGPVCGDGELDPGEGCDDGNTDSGDGCDENCVLETCGDGVVDDGEECDDGPDNSDTDPDACRENCLDPSCGDDVVDTGEECDDGNTRSGDGCDRLCQNESTTCGDGTVDDGEECDDGNDVNTDDCVSCHDARCGDSFIQDGVEECEGDSSQPCTTTCDTEGLQDCTDTCVWDTTCNPPAEICNGEDDDCDAEIDEDFLCLPGDTVECTTTCGSTGSGDCSATCEVPAPADCAAPAETCNGLDDDCLNGADDGFPCVQGSASACTTTCGSAGSGLCGTDCSLPTDCTPPAESCNGEDDDCDGAPDNGLACVQGESVSCTTTCGSVGTGTCSDACALPDPTACTLPLETCNAVDDDCDAAIDEGFECTAGAVQPCTAGACSGTQACDGSTCTWGTCNFGVGPTNDNCTGALPDISSGGTFVGNTCAAANDYTYACGGGGTPAVSADVVFQLNLTADRDVTIDTVGTAFDALLFIRNAGTCPGTTALFCDDNTAGSGQARITRRLTAGSYWVILDGAGAGNRGAYTLNVALMAPPPPANDVCTGATAMNNPGTYAGSSGAATNDLAAACGTGAGPDVWYSFTLGARSLVYLDTVDGNTWNSVLDVRRGACGSTTSVACNDDSCSGQRSQWFGVLEAGTYYVVVDGVTAGSAGAFTLTYQYTQMCADATQITANGNYDGSTADAADTNVLQGGCGGSSAADQRYYVALCAPRSVTATTCNTQTTYNSIVRVRAGGCNEANEIACNNDMGGTACPARPDAARVTVDMPKGLNIIGVDGSMGAEGTYRLTISGL